MQRGKQSRPDRRFPGRDACACSGCGAAVQSEGRSATTAAVLGIPLT
jgi:hypothetical protein